MASIFTRAVLSAKSRIWNFMHPRAIVWRYIKKRNPNRPIITKLGKDLKVRIYPVDIIGQYIYVDGVFEKRECRFVTSFLKRGMICFDIGANFGQYTLLAARQVESCGQVHSFEPSGRMFRELEFNVNLNDFSNICFLNQVALSDTDGTGKLSCHSRGAEGFGSLGRQARPNFPVITYEEVKIITLDHYIKEHDIKHIDLVKIDVEGAELNVLKGGKQFLSQPGAPTILVELCDFNTQGFGYKALDVWDYLEKLEYRLYNLSRSGRISGLARRQENAPLNQNLVAMKK